MIQLNRFPEGKTRAVTFSYDDGPQNDARLIELFNKYGMKATFHLNGNKYMEMSEEELMAVRELYKDHEISCHTLRHGDMNRMNTVTMVNEVMEDRKILERIAGYPVVGMSYPNGRWDSRVIEVMKNCGIVYSRTTKSTLSGIDAPEDFLEWHPSCHHRDAETVAAKFLETADSIWYKNILYIWGHSFEFRTEEDWQYIENIVSSLANNDLIWYATNIEIYNYIMAQRSLRISADETMIYNPSDIPVWVERNRKDVFKIEPGQTLHLA